MSNCFIHLPYLKKTITKIVMGFCEVRFDFQSSLEMSNRLVHPPYPGETITKIVMSFCEVWFDFQSFLILNDCFIHASCLEQTVTKSVMGFCEVRCDFQSFLKMSNGLVHPPFLKKNITKIVMGFYGFCEIRFDFQSLLILNNRFIHLPFLIKGTAKAGVESRRFGLKCQGLLKKFKCLVRPPLMEKKIAGKVVGLRMGFNTCQKVNCNRIAQQQTPSPADDTPPDRQTHQHTLQTKNANDGQQHQSWQKIQLIAAAG